MRYRCQGNEVWLDICENINVPNTQIDYLKWKSLNNKTSTTVDKFIEYINNSLGKPGGAYREYVQIGSELKSFAIQPTNNKTRLADNRFFSKIHCNDFRGHGEFRDVEGKDLKITNCSNAQLLLSNVKISRLFIYGCPTCDIELNDCAIGTVVLAPNCIRNFTASGGTILNLEVPSPTADNPFVGSVLFDRKVCLPRCSGRLMRGPQMYRNLRSHMTKLENAPMASRFHRLEQLMERESQGMFDKSLSIAYSVLSDYGSSTLRPLLCLLVLLLMSWGFILLLHGAVLVPGHDAGWQANLSADGLFANERRAFVLVAQSTLNPLGALGSRGAVIASNGWVAAWLTLHGFVSALLAALFIFAVRRRFKIT